MDFAQTYTAEQETFRKEVQQWLDANLPPNLEIPPTFEDYSDELYRMGRDFRRKLGEKGWHAPTWPKDIGGGGLTTDHAIVIGEELSKRKIPTVPDAFGLCAPAISAWGTDEMKRDILPRMLRGEIIVWQCFTEPEAGSDLASLKMRAVKDGDDYVISGQKIFVGYKFGADYLYTLAVTDQTAPRHQNISAFLVPADAPGVDIQSLELIAGGGKRTIFYDDVRVPATLRIGDEGKGWWVAQTTLELEHGGTGRVGARESLIDRIIGYAKGHTAGGQPATKDPQAQQTLVDLYIGSHIGRLFNLRNYWMRTSGRKFVHEGSENSLFGKTYAPKLAAKVLDVLGPYALLSDTHYGPLKGEVENQQREATSTHPGGTPEIQRVIIARRMGLSRTPQEMQGSRDVAGTSTH
ncbi:MAG: acyl-CoA dehydrogenase family protein [Chloroflexi bacterium]|nr:acyl-CoA dehydrogenase family protein [Chloroflexota bacterium]